MYHVISTQKAFEGASVKLEEVLPPLVLERLKEVLQTFNEYYGTDRDMDADLGGFCVVFPQMDTEEQTEYEMLLQKYHVQRNEHEYRDELTECNGLVWIEELFVLSTDYGVVLFYPVRK